MFWFQNPAHLDYYFYFTVVSNFFFLLFISHLPPSSPLVFCVSSSSVLIRSLVFFVSSFLVFASSVVNFPSCVSSQPIASCGSPKDTMNLCAASACFLISITSLCRESIMPSKSMKVLGSTLYFSSWKIIYIHLEIANNYTVAISSIENLEDHYEFKHTSTVNSDFKAILWVYV